jgi:cell division protein FtsA
MANRNRHAPAPGVIGLLDVGTSKIACLIVEVGRPRAAGGLPEVRVLGAGHQHSRGLKAGVVVGLDEAEQSVRAAVTEAELMAGLTMHDVFLAVSCGRIKSTTFAADTRIAGRVVADADIERLTAAARDYAERDGRSLLHMNPIAYRLDGGPGMRDPRGMAGHVLTADLHAATADDAPLHNLLHVIERAYLTVAGVAPAPLASGLAATTEEERQAGVICVDMGAGATTISCFVEGHLLAVDAVAVGGHHVTFDIARALSTPLAEAERIKFLCGTLTRTAADDQEVVAYTLAGEEESALYQTTKAHVRGIASARVAGLFGHVAERIERSDLARYATRRMVLTGGGSLLPGVCEVAAEVLRQPVRVARLQPLAGAPAGFASPAFSTVLGLVQVALDPGAGVRVGPSGRLTGTDSYFGIVRRWLRESF